MTVSVVLAGAAAAVSAQGGAVTLTAVSASANPAIEGDAVVFTARVSLVAPAPALPTGSVEFFDGDVSLGTATLTSNDNIVTASLSVDSLAAGPHVIIARYVGDPTCAPSDSPLLSHVVLKSSAS